MTTRARIAHAKLIRRSRPAIWAVALASSTVLLSGCSGRDTVEILDGTADPSSHQLMLGVASCNAELEVKVEEGDDHVRITITRPLPGKAEDHCQDLATIELNEPLGDRTVIDGGTGQTVEISKNDG